MASNMIQFSFINQNTKQVWMWMLIILKSNHSKYIGGGEKAMFPILPDPKGNLSTPSKRPAASSGEFHSRSFLRIWGDAYILAQSGLFWLKNNIKYQHKSIQQGMNPSPDKKVHLKFRYQIQYTNQISDNDFFQSRSHAQDSFLKSQRYHHDLGEFQKMDSELQKTKNQRRKMGKDQPIILVQNLRSDENNSGRMEEQSCSHRHQTEDKDMLNMMNRNSTPKKSKGNNQSCMMTATPKDMKGLEQDERKAKNSRKGLAWISSHILQLLEGQYRQDKKFTCGQISDRVLTDFYSKSKEKLNENSIEQKEKKTIRRRVYDSINVLIALGKIKKDHKFLFVESIDRKIGQEIVTVKRDKLTYLKSQLERKQNLLRKAKNEYSKLIQLKTRNEELSQSKQQGYSGTFSTFSPSHNIYRFPLLFVYGEPHSKMSVVFDSQSDQAHESKDQIILFVDPLYILSELSSLQYLNFSQSRPVPHRKEVSKRSK